MYDVKVSIIIVLGYFHHPKILCSLPVFLSLTYNSKKSLVSLLSSLILLFLECLIQDAAFLLVSFT